MLRYFLAVAAISLLSTQYGECAKILGIFPLNGHSHWTPNKALLEALANRGHEVTVVGHFPRKTPLPNYKDISLAGTLPDFVNNVSYSFVTQMGFMGGALVIWTMAGAELCKNLLHTPQFQELAKSNEKYDLIITETFGTDCFLSFVDKFKTPWISMSCATPFDWMAEQIDMPILPSTSPLMLTSYPDKMDFWERTGNFLMHIGIFFGYHYVSRIPSQRVAREVLPQTPDLYDLSRSASLLLSNSHFSLTGSRPGVPAHVEVGGIHITPEPSPLPKDIQKLLDDAKQGVIYFSFGSMIQSETIPRQSLEAMLAAFAKKPHLVLWKANPKNFPPGLVLPKNVVTQKWLPQRDILAHPNVKVFVTHGGLLGTMEGVYCGIPMIGVPMFGDQLSNIKNYVRRGIALMVNVQEIEEKFEKSLNEVLTDKKFKETALKVSKQFKDRPAPPLDTAVFWTEYVLRHQGAPQLRTPGKFLKWYQIWLFDVIGFVGAVVLGILFVLYFTCKMAFRSCMKSTPKDIRKKKN
ncbi:UDP-glucuronosyltransferase 1-9-like [Ctenocephalides felis]|uniref:UDP-glucuronosyltransferase 1-9-like n=1 Tax=Ctenocephalides felis TaxID=7515 RepID=UPI000E6E31BA|nr:UDP-glucuronosyltransferase 1-9-like [Ctenocephalides felis]